jgi:hypothetical protein
MAWNNGIATFTANGALGAKIRVKLTAGSAATPPQVEVAAAGEQHIGITEFAVASGALVSVKLRNFPGIHEATAAEAIAVGATIYGAAAGKVQDTSSGTAIGIAIEEATALNDVIKIIDFTVISTTAATVSIADAAGHTTATTVEAALAELYASIDTSKKTIPVPLGAITNEDGTALTKFVSEAAASMGFSQESNKEVVLRFNNHATPGKVAFSVPMPQELDGAAVVEVHWLALMSGATDTPDLEHEAYFGAADTDCAGTDDEIDGGAALTEYSATIAASDVPDTMPSVLTVVFGPKAGEMGTDDLLVYAVWLEVEYAKLSA